MKFTRQEAIIETLEGMIIKKKEVPVNGQKLTYAKLWTQTNTGNKYYDINLTDINNQLKQSRKQPLESGDIINIDVNTYTKTTKKDDKIFENNVIKNISRLKLLKEIQNKKKWQQ